MSKCRYGDDADTEQNIDRDGLENRSVESECGHVYLRRPKNSASLSHSGKLDLTIFDSAHAAVLHIR